MSARLLLMILITRRHSQINWIFSNKLQGFRSAPVKALMKGAQHELPAYSEAVGVAYGSQKQVIANISQLGSYNDSNTTQPGKYRSKTLFFVSIGILIFRLLAFAAQIYLIVSHDRIYYITVAIFASSVMLALAAHILAGSYQAVPKYDRRWILVLVFSSFDLALGIYAIWQIHITAFIHALSAALLMSLTLYSRFA